MRHTSRCSCDVTRRGFLVGCSTAIAAMAAPRFQTLAFAAQPGADDEILVTIFLRGGMDGLHVVMPTDGVDRGHYQTLRPGLQMPASGAGAALPLTAPFGLHPSAAPLHDLWQAGHLAIVHAVGLPSVNRSHFDAMQFVELGTPGVKGTTTGWLTRHLQTAPGLPSEIVVPSLAVGDLQPQSLLGSIDTLNVADPGSFDLQNGPWLWRSAQRTALRNLYEADTTWNHVAGLTALDALDIVELNVQGGYTPANGAVYPDTAFGLYMRTLAQMIKLDLGLHVATVDLGGWDTHESEGDGAGGYFADLLDELARGVAALYTDLDGAGGGNYTSRLTVVVQSEFGREARENGDGGTEHGYGNLMMVLGGHVNGGFHGTWPGLAPAQLFEGTDVAVTTDYRRVLSEILVRRLRNPNLAQVFPGYTGYAPLGVVQGDDAILQQPIFGSGFEAGSTAGWATGG